MYVYWFLCVLVYYASNSELTFIFHILSIIAEKYTHIDRLTCTYLHTDTHTHTHTHTHTNTYTHSFTLAVTYAQITTLTNTHIHINTYI